MAAAASESPLLASLARTLALVPLAVVPAVVDCFVVSSAFSPPELLASLLAVFKRVLEDDHSKLESSSSCQLISYAAALVHLIKKPDVSDEDFEMFIRSGLLPLLASSAADDKEFLDMLEDWLPDVLAANQRLDLIKSTLVPLCLRSVCLSLEIPRPNVLSICQWDSIEYVESSSVSLTVASRILSSLIGVSLRETITTLDVELTNGIKSSEALARELTWDLSLIKVDILLQSSEKRSEVIRLLFPVILRRIYLLPSFDVLVNSKVHTFSRVHFFRNLWQRCISMLSLGIQERRDAYSLISLYLSLLNAEGHANDGINDECGMTEDEIFWEEVRKGLVDKDASVRKHSLYILKMILKHGNPQSTLQSLVPKTVTHEDNAQRSGISRRGRWADEEAKSMGIGEVHRCNVNGVDNKWSVFFLLYEMLEEYGTHLVEAAWTHQMSLFFQYDACESVVSISGERQCRNQMQDLCQMFNWLAILWQRGFFHENPQVRCLIMNSFLGMDWKSQRRYAKYVPKCFVLGPFISGLNDPIHHKDFGLGGYYNSIAIQAAKEFIHQYAVDLCESERLDFVFHLANIARKGSFGRAGLMAFASCLASAAIQTEQLNPRALVNRRSSELLDSFGVIIERSKQHFNPNYRLQVCERVMEATSAMLWVEDLPLEILLHFISTLPRDFTDFGGTLRIEVKRWLHSKSGILRQLVGFPENFVKCDVNIARFDDEDMDAWIAEAQRWVRLLFLMIQGDQDLEPVYQFIKDAGCGIFYNETVPYLFPPKFLVLVICLVDEVQIILKKWTLYSQSSSNVDRATDMANQLFPVEAIFSFKLLRSTFLCILEGLTSFSTCACSIFWQDRFGLDINLPSSMNGKLGGPSPRRLPQHLTASILCAILSLRAVSSVLSVTMQLGKDLDLISSFTFLWDICSKVLLLRVDLSETGSEIHMAANEAVGYVLKALSPLCSSSFHEAIMNSNICVFGAEPNEFLLDPFFINFLSSINGLIDRGNLTRSRRAILMKWKWHCLDSLLSVPYSESESGVYPSTAHSFFSDSILLKTTSDIVESLENAGEASVLPLLRCVRSIIGILHGNTRYVVTPGFDALMMMDLVQSSWTLHQSCNKRRIAPIAALLSSILHPLLFCDHSMHRTSNGGSGPFKWLIKKILQEGTKSPRTLRLAALHLTGLWFSHPSTIKYYIKELTLLSLHGSVAFDEDFAAELSENQEAVLEVSMLAKIPNSELAEVFINTETYARASVAVLFEKLGYLAQNCKNLVDNDHAQSSHYAGKMFLLDLLDSAVNDKDLAKELYKKHSAIHRRKVRAWQMLCVVSGFIDQLIVDEVSSKMHICLHRNNMPSVRQYLETFAIQIYLKFPSLVEGQLLPIFHNYDIRPQALSSYVFIAANVILHTSEVSHQLKHLNTLLPPIIPLLTSHHHSLRGFSQLLVYLVLCKLAPILEKGSYHILTIEKRCFEELRLYLVHNADCARLRASMGGIFDSFDPKNAASAIGVFNARNEVSQFECVPITLMEQVNEFLNSAREELRLSMAKDTMAIKNERDSVIPFPQLYVGSQKHFQKKITPDGLHNMSRGFEGGDFSAPEDAPRLLSEFEKEDQLFHSAVQSRNHEIRQLRGREQTIILVASLIDRIPNLAGLARTCEVFRAAGLTVADLSIVQDKQFQLISVTADKWVPIVEVPASNLKSFLHKKKHEGFSILGLEQTTNSTSIDRFSFPKKTVLVLGHEKEGIPVDIIHCMDACVEIPQLGVVRSLNVHVSGAIALWEYTRQHRSSS